TASAGYAGVPRECRRGASGIAGRKEASMSRRARQSTCAILIGGLAPLSASAMLPHASAGLAREAHLALPENATLHLYAVPFVPQRHWVTPRHDLAPNHASNCRRSRWTCDSL